MPSLTPSYQAQVVPPLFQHHYTAADATFCPVSQHGGGGGGGGGGDGGLVCVRGRVEPHTVPVGTVFGSRPPRSQRQTVG